MEPRICAVGSGIVARNMARAAAADREPWASVYPRALMHASDLAVAISRLELNLSRGDTLPEGPGMVLRRPGRVGGTLGISGEL